MTTSFLNLYKLSNDKRAEEAAFHRQIGTLRNEVDIMSRKIIFVVCLVSVFVIPGSAFGVFVPGSSITAQAASQLSSETSPDNSINGIIR